MNNASKSEVGNVYYINYNIEKALFSIQKIKELDEKDNKKICFYCHVYLDLLVEAIGQIYDRFKSECKKTKEIARSNRELFAFDENTYPKLSSKVIRNHIEHIMERDKSLLKHNNYFGTFNVIHPYLSKKKRENLLSDINKQNNLFNMETMTYRVIRMNDKKQEETEMDLIEIEKELNKLHDISKSLYNSILFTNALRME